MKYARIIAEIASVKGIDRFDAMHLFYNSPLFPLIDSGVAEPNCRSDKYLATEIIEDTK